MTSSSDPFKHAIHTLYEDHQPWLFQWLRRKMCCTEQAAEVSHDTYVRIIQTGRTPPMQDGRAHLVQIAKGLMIDRFRRSAVEQAYLESIANHTESFHPSPEEERLVLEALIAVDNALTKLSKRTRAVFLLSQLDGLTYKAIAQQLGISFSTVRKDMFTALKACHLAMSQISTAEAQT